MRLAALTELRWEQLSAAAAGTQLPRDKQERRAAERARRQARRQAREEERAQHEAAEERVRAQVEAAEGEERAAILRDLSVAVVKDAENDAENAGVRRHWAFGVVCALWTTLWWLFGHATAEESGGATAAERRQERRRKRRRRRLRDEPGDPVPRRKATAQRRRHVVAESMHRIVERNHVIGLRLAGQKKRLAYFPN